MPPTRLTARINEAMAGKDRDKGRGRGRDNGAGRVRGRAKVRDRDWGADKVKLKAARIMAEEIRLIPAAAVARTTRARTTEMPIVTRTRAGARRPR